MRSRLSPKTMIANHKSPRGAARIALAAAAALALIALGFAAGRLTVHEVRSASDVPAASLEPELWTVKEEHIGREFTFGAVVKSNAGTGPAANHAGIITAVYLEGASELGINSRILDVDLVPIVAGKAACRLFVIFTKAIKEPM